MKYRTLLAACLLLLTANWGRVMAGSATGTPDAMGVDNSALQWVSSTEVKRVGDTLTIERALADLDQMPVLRLRMYPDYPRQAKELGLEAKVVVKALVDTDGSVRAAQITEPSQQNPKIGFEQAALEAAMESLYHPAIIDGKPVAAWVVYAVAFELD